MIRPLRPRRRRSGVVVLALLASVLLASGCLRRAAPSIRYYRLVVDAPAVPTSSDVRVVGFSAEPPYSSARMAFRPSPYRLAYHTFHRWAANPQALVTAAARQYFGTDPDDGDATIYLSGRILRLEAVPQEDPPQASLALALVARHGGRSILKRTYEEAEPLDGDDKEAIAAALSRALTRVFERFQRDLDAVVAP